MYKQPNVEQAVQALLPKKHSPLSANPYQLGQVVTDYRLFFFREIPRKYFNASAAHPESRVQRWSIL
jgi:hypothetical protein